jgi:thiol-disulfide isomerase/thioredoxin
VVFFFEDNCPACSDELLKLLKFSQKTENKNIIIFAVYTGDNRDVFVKYSDFFPENWTAVWDPHLSFGISEDV